jgi:hypothetical protein
MDALSRRERFERLVEEPDLARRRLVALALVADRLAGPLASQTHPIWVRALLNDPQ